MQDQGMQEETPIRIVVIGSNNQIRQLLEQIFREHAQSHYTVTEESLAEAGIVDMDGFGARELWKQYRLNHPSLPTIVLSLQPRQLENSIFVQKPVEIPALLQALENIGKQVRGNRDTLAPLAELFKSELGQSAGETGTGEGHVAEHLAHARHQTGYLEDEVCEPHAPWPNLKRAEQVAKLYYNPGDYLQGLLQQAVTLATQKENNIRLEIGEQLLVVSPHTGRIFYTGQENDWRTLAVKPLGTQNKGQGETLGDQALARYLKAATPGLNYQDLERFLWKIAIWSAHGRLPGGVDLETPIILLHWPNFTRLMLTGHALRIAALWRRQPYSLLETARILNIHPCYVFSFFSAVHALGLAFPDRRAQTREKPVRDINAIASEAEEKPSHPKRNLFQRMMTHLRKLRE